MATPTCLKAASDSWAAPEASSAPAAIWSEERFSSSAAEAASDRGLLLLGEGAGLLALGLRLAGCNDRTFPFGRRAGLEGGAGFFH